MDIFEKFFPGGDQIDEEIAPRTTTKANVFRENGTRKGGMGYMGGKKARAAAREKNLRHNRTTTSPGRGQNLKLPHLTKSLPTQALAIPEVL